jgi:hypothetical protein
MWYERRGPRHCNLPGQVPRTVYLEHDTRVLSVRVVRVTLVVVLDACGLQHDHILVRVKRSHAQSSYARIKAVAIIVSQTHPFFVPFGLKDLV